ncbi:MAG: glycosyltransferase family 39 protein [Thermoflexales bacterium]|nr:glycosyltransferase family 39 protein [Thermoflexales bacterium]
MKRSLSELLLLLLAFVVLGLAFGVIIPPFENLDEVEHFGVVRYIAETGRLPVHGTSEAEVYHYRQEASQPPLYHLLSAGLVRLLGLQARDMETYIRFNPRVACGPNAPFLYDNRSIFYHNPHREHFPWRDTLLMLHILRIGSTLLQALTVLGTWALARCLFPDRPGIPPLATAIVAFNPQFLFVASGVNNDNLVTPLATWGLYLLARIWQEGLSARRTLALGILIGLAGLSKLSGWLLLPLSLLVILLAFLRSRPNARFRRQIGPLIGYGAPVVFIPLVLSGWWFWRNWRLYGDLTALTPMLELVGRRGSPIYPWNEAGLVFRSFWGQIPCSFFPTGFYIPYILLTGVGIIGLLWGWRRFRSPERWAAGILAAWLLLVLAGWVRWDMITPAPGGRLLFPALPAVAILLALGISSLPIPPLVIRPLAIRSLAIRSLVIPSLVIPSLVILLASLALWTAVDILPAFYAPPPRYADTGAVRPQHSVQARFGDSIHLLGYDLSARPEESFLDVTLYWQTTAPIPDDYVMALQLVSPIPGDDTLRWTYDSWPGHGNYPTSAWRPGEVIWDRYRFRLPEADFPTQAWDLQVVLYHPERGSLPVSMDETPVGGQLLLSRLRFPGATPTCPASDRLAAEVRLGESVALTHAGVTADGEETQVTLCWRSLAPLTGDYHVFVHLYDASGTLLAAGDGPPMGGAFPSSLWQPGDVILDIHRLPPLVEGGRVAVGLYQLEDGARLPVTVNGTPVPDAAIPVWPQRP